VAVLWHIGIDLAAARFRLPPGCGKEDEGGAAMRRSTVAAVLATAFGLLALAGSAAAQSTRPYVTLLPGSEEVPEAASPTGAVYIPGIGFRYLPPPGARLYGYRAYAPPAYGYRSYRRACGYRPRNGRCARAW
jgi:hypothetical protein